jgi:hypothetical protein
VTFDGLTADAAMSNIQNGYLPLVQRPRDGF